MLHVPQHGPARRASTSSTLSHADSFHSLPPSSHEASTPGHAVTLPCSCASTTTAAYADAYAQSSPDNTASLFVNRPCDDKAIIDSTEMERKDSKFTVASSSASIRRAPTHKRTTSNKSPTASRRPSLSRNSMSLPHSQRPQLGSRRNTHSTQSPEDAYARACAIFPPPSTRPASQIYSAPTSQSSLVPKARLSPANSFEQHHGQRTAVQSRNASFAATTASTMDVRPAATTNDKPVVAHRPRQTIIDWTDPDSRRKTYEKYDQDRRGVRGLWRKLTPDCFWRGSRVEFYDEKNDDDDTKSVRRHRLELDDLKEGLGQDDEGNDDRQQTYAQRTRVKRSWTCFGPARESCEI